MLRSLITAITTWLLVGLATVGHASGAGTWVPLNNQAPTEIGTMLLLSNGVVIATGATGGPIVTWYSLTPDNSGSYINGTWAQIASMHDSRLFFASDVLPNGQVFVAGGEYGTGMDTAEVYNPTTNTWTYAPDAGQQFLDALSITLPNGNVLISPLSGGTIIYNYLSNSWIPGPTLFDDFNEAESSWVKLADGSILTIDSGSTTAERYIPALNEWVSDTMVPFEMWDIDLGETGSASLLPNGNAFFQGDAGNTAIYSPTGNTSPGAWSEGAPSPAGLEQDDAPAATLTNGNVLCAYGPADSFIGPTTFFEYNPTTNAFTKVGSPGGFEGDATYGERMLDLPDGNVLYTNGGTTQLYEYIPSGPQLTAGQPAVTSVAVNPDGSYLLTGTLLTGISQGATYGDDAQMDTNYPIVTLTSAAGNVCFATTTNWSTTDVMQGSNPETCDFTLPASLAAGLYNLNVIVNGIKSAPFQFNLTDFSLSASPGNVSISQRTSGTSMIIINPSRSFTGSVTFSASGLPNGVTASFSPASSTTSTVLTLSANATATTGPAMVTVTGTSGASSATTTIALQVNGNYTLSPNPASLTIDQRTSGISTIAVVPTGGFAGIVSFAASGLPSGVTASFSPASSTTSTVVTLAASATAATGKSTVTITGTSGSLTNSTTISLTVNGNYTLSAGPNVIALKQAKSLTSTISVSDTGGFAGTVAFSVSGLPAGVTASFSPTSSASSTILTLTASPTAALGLANLTVTGTSGVLSNTTNIALTVNAGWTVTGFTLAPANVVGGSAAAGTVTLSDPAPAGGKAVAISVPASSAPYVSFPSTVTVPAGQTAYSFGGIQTHTTPANEVVNMTATLGSTSATVSLYLSFVAGGTQAAGLEFFSSPWAYHDILPKIFENPPSSGQIAGWNAANLAYNYMGGSIASPAPVTIMPGVGYWAVFPAGGESLLYLGAPASQTSPTVVALSPGYNAIGDPYTSPVSISSLTFGGGKMTFAQATGKTGALISPTLYYFVQGINSTVGTYSPTGAGDALTPGKGYWIYAYRSTSLTFPLVK